MHMAVEYIHQHEQILRDGTFPATKAVCLRNRPEPC
jgi:hypothetical protein